MFQVNRDVMNGYSDVVFILLFVDDEYTGLVSKGSYGAWINEIGLK